MYTTNANAILTRRRGIVLVLVLALLSLLALIGVTFATLAGQAQVGARNYAMARAAELNPETFFDYALSQLINDSNNPKSALRGHSLLRDMYGHDARRNGHLPNMPDPLGWPLAIWNVTNIVDNGNGTRTYTVETNIPTANNSLISNVPQLATYFFGPYQLYPGGPFIPGWTMRLQQWVVNPASQNGTTRNPGAALSQFVSPEVINTGAGNDIPSTVGRTFEIVGDNAAGPWHIFQLAPVPLAEVKVGMDGGATVDQPTVGLITPDTTPALVPGPANRVNLIELDNRYLRSFNGSGMSQEGLANYIPPQFINFLFNNISLPNGGFTDANNFTVPAMDEDYDAADHENVFLGLQSADGQVVIPSFHRPNMVIHAPNDPGYAANPELYSDWVNAFAGRDPRDNHKRAKILRPRRVDHPLSGDAFPDLTPDPATGKITYDVDNDGDGVTDAIWLDLGYPAQRNADGKLYKPLFAFTVIGLNGRLPLNTSGNLQARSSTNYDVLNSPTDPLGNTVWEYRAGQRTFRHASNLGYSPFEINPSFALTYSNAADAPLPDYPDAGRDGTWPLRRILTGNNDPNAGITAGRYGEPEAFSAGQVPAAGRSYHSDASKADLLDANFNGTDFLPQHTLSYIYQAGRYTGYVDPNNPAPPAPRLHPEIPFTAIATSANYYDGANRLLLPSERMRHFVTPVDITGAGRVMEWDQLPSTTTAPLFNNTAFGLGFDRWGRVSYFQYFRPPGFPADLLDDPADVAPFIDRDLKSAHLANRLHGFESHRNPATASMNAQPPAVPTDRTNLPHHHEFMARAPWNVFHDNPANPMPNGEWNNQRLPTMTNTINSTDLRSMPFYNLVGGVDGLGDPMVVRNGMYPGRNPDYDNAYFPANRDAVYTAAGGTGLALTEDFQMNLYAETPYDKLFDGRDLEWLYRRDDRDGTSLASRLEALAVVNDINGNPFRAFVDDDPASLRGSARRKLFSTDSWELNRYAWSQNHFSPFFTPNGAAVGRKINLNHPLPFSHSSTEPTRVKWCRDAFDLLVNLFYPNYDFTTFPPTWTGNGAPPPAPPKPEDIARIGQYVVNIIDFRDTDDTMTRFVNPYLKVYPSEVEDLNNDGTFPEDHNGNGFIEPARVTWIGDNTFDPAAEELNLDGGLNLYQWGMEYLPVALNEVLAYQYVRKDPGQTGANKAARTRRLFVELVNMLTEDADGDQGRGGSASDLGLRGWGFVITPDRPAYTPPTQTTEEIVTRPERPNTVTGQIKSDLIKNSFIPLVPSNAGVAQPLATPIHALDASHGDNALPNHSDPNAGNDRNFVLANATPPPAGAGNPAELNTPRNDAVLDIAHERRFPLFPMGSGEAEYFWIHLVRPANPHADPAGMDTEPKVVVDSFRFPYTEAGATIQNPGTTMEQEQVGPARRLYSVGRSQPLRGGHAVPDSHRFTPPYAYGYTEQSHGDDDTDSPFRGMYFRENSMNGNLNVEIVEGSTDTDPMGNVTYDYIRESLGSPNDETENWDYFPFHDRDFANVAELLMVPEAPPGLFTKKFAEDTGYPDTLLDAADGFRSVDYPIATPPPDRPNHPNDLREPHAYPYLAQRFNYWNSANPNDRAAWYMMLEFFEVPSPVLGAIGPAANGDNGDWQRNDLRPGAINLNLIIDEEVFFGLIDDPRLANLPAFRDPMTPPSPNTGVPQVITALDPDGNPTATYSMSDLAAHPYGRGFWGVRDPITWVDINGVTLPYNAMKAAFSDFIKLRHGGSGYIGGVRNVNPPITFNNGIGNSLPEKPFRSLTALYPNQGAPANPYLSIYDTIMRPARLGAVSGDVATMPAVQMDVLGTPADTTDDPWYFQTTIPPRMLFQVPFSEGGNGPPTAGVFVEPNPAGELSNPAFMDDHGNLRNANADIFDRETNVDVNPNHFDAFLGGSANGDRRRHPYWQTEILQKLINNTTVRTHQFAVWVTIGLFEVVQEGDSSKVLFDPNLAVDQLGKELGKDAGKSRRYKAFFIVDRTRATGFDPNDPTDFRPMVVYRKRIE